MPKGYPAGTVPTDLTGAHINRLTVLHMAERQPCEPKKWVCRCDCGNLTTVWQSDLKRARTQSCGCYHQERQHRTHGLTQTAEYSAWVQMRKRCSPDAPGPGHRERYFERGIRVCERWAGSFEAFLEDMGPRPSSRHSIDRIDNNGGYEPKNCRWATRLEQANNLECTLYARYEREWVPVAELARRLRLPRHVVHNWAIGQHRATGTVLEGVRPRTKQAARKNMKRKAA